MGTPVVFIHGLFLHAASWSPWVDLFRAAGYEPAAPGWPGDPDTVEDARANPESIADHGIDDITAHYAKIIGGTRGKAVLIGHSLGGVIAQKLLDRHLAAAAVGIDSVQVMGVPPLPRPELWATLPVFKNPANIHKAVSLTAEQFRSVFGTAISAAESQELYERWAIPAPGKPLFEVPAAAPDPHRPGRGPLLLIAGGRGHTAPPTVADLVEFPDRAHSLTIDHGWRDVADAALSWLKRLSR